jgi:hypothetical protein
VTMTTRISSCLAGSPHRTAHMLHQAILFEWFVEGGKRSEALGSRADVGPEVSADGDLPQVTGKGPSLLQPL